MNIIDRLVSVFSPQRALVRSRARMALRIYEAAEPGRRTNAFNARRTSANVEIGRALTSLRSRSRDLVRNSPYAKRIVAIYGGHLVGLGMPPIPRTGSDRLDAKVARLWEEWQQEADVEGRLTHYAQQLLAVRSVIESGEVVARFDDRPDRE